MSPPQLQCASPFNLLSASLLQTTVLRPLQHLCPQTQNWKGLGVYDSLRGCSADEWSHPEMRIQPLALRHNIFEAVIYTPETSGGLRLKLLSWEFSEIKAFLIYFLLCCTSLSSLTFSSGSTSLYTNPHLRVCFWGLQLRSQVKHCFPKTLNDFQHWSQQHNILIFCIRLKALCSLKASRNHILFRYFILFFTEPGDKVYTK